MILKMSNAEGDVLFCCLPSDTNNICIQARSVEVGGIIKNFKSSSNEDQVGCIALAGSHYLLGALLTKPFIAVWALQKEQVYLRISCVGRVEALACTFDGVYCAGAVREKIYIWEIGSGQLLAIAQRHFQTVTALRFSDTGTHLISGSKDNSVVVWRVPRLLSEGFSNSGMEKCISTDGYVGHASDKEQTVLHSWSHHTQPVSAVYCTQGGKLGRVVTASLDRTCKVYEMESGQLLCSLLFDSSVSAVMADVAETWLFVGLTTGSIVQVNLYLPSSIRGAGASEKGRAVFKGHSKSISHLCLSSRGTLLISASKDGTVRTWDIRSKQTLKVMSLKVPVTDMCLLWTSLTLKCTGPLKVPPLKPFLKQPFTSEGSQEMTAADNDSLSSELHLSETQFEQDGNSHDIDQMIKTLSSKSQEGAAKMSEVSQEKLLAEITKMQKIHKSLFQFTKESLLNSTE